MESLDLSNGLKNNNKRNQMATILKLTIVKKETPLRVNFDLVTHYHGTSNGTEILFLGERYHQERVKVKETPEEIDRLLGQL